MSKEGGKIYILEGSVGAGKSSLAKASMQYAEQLFGKGTRVAVMRESVNERFLRHCIADPKLYALPFQICMARDRIETMQTAQRYAREGYVVLVDRGLPGDITFAHMHAAAGNIDTDQLQLYYSHLLHGMPRLVPSSLVGGDAGRARLGAECNSFGPVDICCDKSDERPDDKYIADAVIVYLHVTPEQARTRVQRRGNAAEIAGYDDAYFRSLHDEYESTISTFADEWGARRVVRYEYGARGGAVDAGGLPTLGTCADVWRAVHSATKAK